MTDKPISKIKQLRERLGLSQTELAYIVGVSVDTIANWESGRRGLDAIERFIRLCKCLKCMPEDLIMYPSKVSTSLDLDINDFDVEEEIDLLKSRILQRKTSLGSDSKVIDIDVEDEIDLLKSKIMSRRNKLSH